MRVIKRYANRKLYDATDSHYVTLQQLAEVIRRGEEVAVHDHLTGKDLTAQTLAQIILTEELKSPRLPVTGLVGIIRDGLPSDKAAA